MQRRSILIVAWYFPPDGGAGSQRPASFARNLPELGWDTTVVTRSEEHDRSRWELRDDSLMAAIGQKCDVVRVQEQGQLTGLPKSFESAITTTAGPFVDRVCEIAQQQNPDVILITMSPFCLASLVEPLKAKTNARVILDLRDPWVLDYWPEYGTGSRMRFQQRLMSESVSMADGIIMNTPAAREDFVTSFSEALQGKNLEHVSVVPNGFTHEDFSHQQEPCSSDHLEIVHAGTFHCEYVYPPQSLRSRLSRKLKRSRGQIDRRGRTPFFLLQALASLRNEARDVFDDIRFRFNGHTDALLEKCIAESGISDKVTLSGYVSHEQTVRDLSQAGALFLPGADLPDGVEDLIVPGKTYEYLASCRPIIAALPPGDAKKLLEEAGGSYPCTPCSVDSIAGALRQLHADWKSGRFDDLAEQRAPILDRFERSAIAKNLASYLEKVVTDRVT